MKGNVLQDGIKGKSLYGGYLNNEREFFRSLAPVNVGRLAELGACLCNSDQVGI